MIKPFGSCFIQIGVYIKKYLLCDMLKWHKHSNGASEEDDGSYISCCRRCWKPIYVDENFKLIAECEDADIKRTYKIVRDRIICEENGWIELPQAFNRQTENKERTKTNR